jgi:hypothetical protein
MRLRLARRWSRALPSLLLLLASCAGPGTEQHLAPVYTHISTVGGGEEYDAVAGAVIARRYELGEEFREWGLRPLFLHWPDRDERSKTQFLFPLGRVVSGGGEFNWWLLPIIDYRREDTVEGRKWTLLSLPGIYLVRFPDGRQTNIWWPFYGEAVELLSYDELDFVLWPIFMRSKREGRTTWHLPYPFLSYTSGPDGGGWRVWPLIGHTWVEDSYDRWFALWPIFNYNVENLKSDPAFYQTQWTIFPLYGQQTQGSYTSRTFLWPFFGYASDPTTGFWAYDGPWPLVRIQRPGSEKFRALPDKQGAFERTRFWPVWSEYKGDGLTSYWYLWPLINKRHEEYYDSTRDAFTIVPIWTQWKKRYDDGRTHSYRKGWPLFQYERLDDTRKYLFPALSPFWYWPDLDAHYSWLYAIYTTEVSPETRKEYALWGLWRREHDLDEDRSYLSGLWSRRDYSQGGQQVSENSLLFGLFRWRSDEEGMELMRPAFPGPGWPIERTPSSLSPSSSGGATP